MRAWKVFKVLDADRTDGKIRRRTRGEERGTESSEEHEGRGEMRGG